MNKREEIAKAARRVFLQEKDDYWRYLSKEAQEAWLRVADAILALLEGGQKENFLTEQDAKNVSDADKLRMIADWFDEYRERRHWTGTEVQADLRRIADELEAKHG